MDEVVIREKLKQIIVDNNYREFIELSKEDHNSLLAQCINLSEVDWLFEQRILDKAVDYVLTEDISAAFALAKELKAALANYYNVHLEELFDDELAGVQRNAQRGEEE